VRIVSPVPGTARTLADVPDPMFSECVVGPGAVVEPWHLARMTVRAPCDGIVAAVHPYAFVVAAAPRIAVLVQVGINTMSLAGRGFSVYVAAGARVTAGDRVLSWSPVEVADAGLSTLCVVVALQAERDQVTALAVPGAAVEAGDPVLDWPQRPYD